MLAVNYIIIFLAFAWGATAEHDYYKKGQIGEYYDYDVEGSPRKRVINDHAYSLSHALKKPVKALDKSAHVSYRALKQGSSLLEKYLKGTAQDAKQQQKLAHALTDWETALSANIKARATKSSPGLLYAPKEAWRLFKYSLYLAGFALPRALKRGAKDIIVNTLRSEDD